MGRGAHRCDLFFFVSDATGLKHHKVIAELQRISTLDELPRQPAAIEFLDCDIGSLCADLTSALTDNSIRRFRILCTKVETHSHSVAIATAIRRPVSQVMGLVLTVSQFVSTLGIVKT